MCQAQHGMDRAVAGWRPNHDGLSTAQARAAYWARLGMACLWHVLGTCRTERTQRTAVGYARPIYHT